MDGDRADFHFYADLYAEPVFLGAGKGSGSGPSRLDG